MTNLSTLAATGNALDLVLAEVQGTAKVTHLPVKKAPKSGSAQRNRRALGGEVGVSGVAVGKGKNGNLNRVGGIGKEMVADLDAVKERYARVKAAEHREAAREKAAEARARREAAAFAALDDLLG